MVGVAAGGAAEAVGRRGDSSRAARRVVDKQGRHSRTTVAGDDGRAERRIRVRTAERATVEAV